MSTARWLPILAVVALLDPVLDIRGGCFVLEVVDHKQGIQLAVAVSVQHLARQRHDAVVHSPGALAGQRIIAVPVLDDLDLGAEPADLGELSGVDTIDLDAEPMSLRERYGFMEAFDPHDPMRCGAPNWAQRMVLARNLLRG